MVATMVQLVDRGEEGLGVHVFRLACVQDVLRLTFELTGPLWRGGIWPRMKWRAKCRHAAMGPVERMVRPQPKAGSGSG